MDNKIEKIRNLVNELNEASDAYYNSGNPIMSDLEFDIRFKELQRLEEEMLERINNLGIGPGGLGGRITAYAVNIETYPTHIAGLPVAVNICCHVNRHSHRVI